MSCTRPLLFLALLLALFGLLPAQAESEGAGVIRLRGGLDLDETYADGGRGALFGVDAAFAAARDFGRLIGGIVAESTVTGYADPSVPAAQRHDLSLELANKAEAMTFRSTSGFIYDANDALRAAEIRQRLRIGAAGGDWRPYLTGEAAYLTLNETSGLFGGAFLPTGHRWLRATLIPGVKAGTDKVEVGTALRLSANRYLERFDDFGFRRDNARVEPTLFATLSLGKLQAFGALSRFTADWSDGDFAQVRKTMFDGRASYDFGKLAVSASARRVALDTTFPLSPLILATLYELRADLSFGEKWSGFLFARNERFAYVETPLVTRTKIIGGGIGRDFGEGWSGGVEAAHATGATNLIDDGTPALIAFAYLSHRFGGASAKGRRATLPSPADLTPGQALRARRALPPQQ